MVRDTAKDIVEDIIKDLCGRRGLRQEWEACDEEVVEEIKETWLHIVREHLAARIMR